MWFYKWIGNRKQQKIVLDEKLIKIPMGTMFLPPYGSLNTAKVQWISVAFMWIVPVSHTLGTMVR